MIEMLPFFLLPIGFFLLIKGADIFIDGTSGIGKLLKIPPIIIGLTVVAFGTSAPELAVSITSAIKGQNEIAVGNVIGSNVFNLLMVLGISAIIRPLVVNKIIIKRDFPLSILCTAAALFMCADIFLDKGEYNFISRSEGLLLLSIFAIFLYSLFGQAKKDKELSITNPSKESNSSKEKNPTWWKYIVLSILGVIGIIFGGNMVVKGASAVAISLGMSEMLVGVTIVAIGTSLPELVTSIVAARKGDSDIAVGNVIGSNIFNLLLILGVSAIINPMQLPKNIGIDLLILLIMTIVAFFFSINKKITRIEGAFFVLAYIGYFTYSILSQY